MDNVTLIRVVSGFLFFLVLIPLYFVPSMVGWKKKNGRAIFILNLLAGWTFIGWIVALVWSLTKDSEAVAINTVSAVVLCPACGRYSQPGSKFCASCGYAFAPATLQAVGTR